MGQNGYSTPDNMWGLFDFKDRVATHSWDTACSGQQGSSTAALRGLGFGVLVCTEGWGAYEALRTPGALKDPEAWSMRAPRSLNPKPETLNPKP